MRNRTNDENDYSKIESQKDFLESRLGAARAQYHKNYIISETHEGIVIIDQHAAHERLVMEKMKLDSKLISFNRKNEE